MSKTVTNLLIVMVIIIYLIIIPLTYLFVVSRLNTPKVENITNNIEISPPKVYEMRVSAYKYDHNKKSAIMEKVQAGRTAAVSPACIELLGEKIYIEGHGIRYVNDLTANWLDEKFDVCTIDLAVDNNTDTSKIGSKIRRVIRLK